MSHTLGIRQAQKLKTRQALMDAASVLLEEQSLSSLGLREVTRAVGVAPTAFYRHFRSTADLGRGSGRGGARQPAPDDPHRP